VDPYEEALCSLGLADGFEDVFFFNKPSERGLPRRGELLYSMFYLFLLICGCFHFRLY
jgi:hypothetical protein